jgi:hypothetical protein
MGRDSHLKNAKRTVGELEDCDRGVFGFNRMQFRRHARLNSIYVAEQPQQQVDRVHGLVEQHVAFRSRCSTSSGIAAVFGWPVPFHLRVDQQRISNKPLVDPSLISASANLFAAIGTDVAFGARCAARVAFCGVAGNRKARQQRYVSNRKY